MNVDTDSFHAIVAERDQAVDTQERLGKTLADVAIRLYELEEQRKIRRSARLPGSGKRRHLRAVK